VHRLGVTNARSIEHLAGALQETPIAFLIAIAQSATGTRLATVDFPRVILGIVAVAVSIPVVGVLIVLLTRRPFRHAWAKAHPPDRRIFAAYLTFQIVVAVIAWISCLLVLRRR